jgi:hypothetical protein
MYSLANGVGIDQLREEAQGAGLILRQAQDRRHKGGKNRLKVGVTPWRGSGSHTNLFGGAARPAFLLQHKPSNSLIYHSISYTSCRCRMGRAHYVQLSFRLSLVLGGSIIFPNR